MAFIIPPHVPPHFPPPFPHPVTPTVISTGFADATGSAYRVTTDQLLVVDAGAGTVSAVNPHSHARTLLGSGFNAPHDIALSLDGQHAYVSESPGTLLRLGLNNLNRSAAMVIASGLNGIDQIALDEAHGFAYVAEFTGGTIQRITLANGARKSMAAIANPRGLLVTADGRFAYVSNDVGNLTRFDFSNGTNAVIAGGFNGPRHLTWADSGQNSLWVAQPNPSGTVLRVDLTQTPARVTTITTTAPANPYSVAVLSPGQIAITSAHEVSVLDLSSSRLSATGPILIAIGFIPADLTHLPGGYADTTMNPGYFFQVKDCPFGGTLPLMINWQGARGQTANYYQVKVNGVLATSPFSDYLWNAPLNTFESVTTTPQNGFYLLRNTGQLWLNEWLGMLLDTGGYPNGLNTISVHLFSDMNPASEIGTGTDPGRSATVMIDNTRPTAIIEQILQQPGNVPINTCGIVISGAPTFTFTVTASAPAHLQAWSLGANWGDNRSMSIASDDYSNHVSPTRVWAGITDTTVPPGPSPWNATVARDPTSTHCAHSFVLTAWDRVIDGWGYIHPQVSYQKSITLLL